MVSDFYKVSILLILTARYVDIEFPQLSNLRGPGLTPPNFGEGLT